MLRRQNIRPVTRYPVRHAAHRPFLYCVLYHINSECLHTAGTHLRRHFDSCVFQRCGIEGFTDPHFRKDVRRDQLVRRHICRNPSVIDHHDPVHIAVKHILQTVLDNHHRLSQLLPHIIDQIDGRLSRGRV